MSLPAADASAIRNLLAQDPRPSYHKDPERIYGMPYGTHDIRFKVADGVAVIMEIRWLLVIPSKEYSAGTIICNEHMGQE